MTCVGNYEVVDVTVLAGHQGDYYEVVFPCPPGKMVLSGSFLGAETETPGGAIGWPKDRPQAVTADGTGWVIEANPSVPTRYTARLVCANL